LFRKGVVELIFDVGAALGAHGRASCWLVVRMGIVRRANDTRRTAAGERRM
jgi:hypothetical protein